MNNPISIAVDAMGGDDSPNKVIEGISIHSNSSKDVNYKIFGDENLINPLITKYNISSNRVKIYHTSKFVHGEDSALSAAKKGKDTSLWLSIECLKNNEADAGVSAGNTGALFVIAKINLEITIHFFVSLKYSIISLSSLLYFIKR